MRRIDTGSFVRATRSTSRDINKRILLNLVRENEPVSRADLARMMRIGRGMITSLVAELLAQGAIYTGSTVAAPRGRRPEMLYVRSGDRLAVAIDIRLSKTYVMLTDFAGRQIALDMFDTLLDPADLVTALTQRISKMLAAHAGESRCEGIGLVVPGMVDRESGVVLRSPQLGWENVEIRKMLSQATALPVHIENAPIACAFARMWLSAGDEKAPQNFVYVTVSDGVGAAVVVGGEVVRGNADSAGEYGHVPLSMDGPECMCGSRGCLEAYTSNLATVTRYLGEEFSPRGARALLSSSGIGVGDVIARWSSGDRQAELALRETARHLGAGLSIVVNSINPGLIFVGGEITAAWDLFADEISAAITRRALTPEAARTPVIPEAAGSLPRLQGATALVAARRFAAPVVA